MFIIDWTKLVDPFLISFHLARLLLLGSSRAQKRIPVIDSVPLPTASIAGARQENIALMRSIKRLVRSFCPNQYLDMCSSIWLLGMSNIDFLFDKQVQYAWTWLILLIKTNWKSSDKSGQLAECCANKNIDWLAMLVRTSRHYFEENTPKKRIFNFMTRRRKMNDINFIVALIFSRVFHKNDCVTGAFFGYTHHSGSSLVIIFIF